VIRRIKNWSLGSIERLNSLGKVSSSGCVSCTQHLELRKCSSSKKRPMDTSGSLWTPNMAKCSEKHSQASKKLQSMSISWSMLQHHFKLLQILTTNDFLKRWLRSAILHLTTCKPTQTTKMLQLHEPTILYGLKQPVLPTILTNEQLQMSINKAQDILLHRHSSNHLAIDHPDLLPICDMFPEHGGFLCTNRC